MNYNPYVAPQGQMQPGAPMPQGAPVQGQPQPWEPIEVITLGWNAFKANWVTLFFTFVVAGVTVIPFLAGYVMMYASILSHKDPSGAMPVMGVGWIMMMLGAPFFSVGLHRIWITAARGGTPTFGMLFDGFDRYFAMLGCTLLMALVIDVGLMLCIVPGFIAILGLSLAPWFVVDQNMGPVAALQASWRVTTGHKMKLFVYMLLSAAVGMVGEFACGIGIYAAYAIIFVGYAVIYMRLTGTATNAPAQQGGYGGGYGPGGPPGGYGGAGPAGYGAPPGGGFGAPPGGGGYGGPPPQGGPGFGGPPPQGGPGGGYGGPPPAGY